MANFRGGNRSGGGRGFSSKGGPASGWERRGFNDRGRRGPAEMHQAVCDNCRKNCEVPFRPTSGKPIFCSSCFEGNRSSDPRQSSFEEKRMFEAVCDECGNSCKVPFQPSGGKPVYCSDCFGGKKNAGENKNGDQFEVLNNKLDKILALLTPVETAVIEEPIEVKKKPSKKKTEALP